MIGLDTSTAIRQRTAPVVAWGLLTSAIATAREPGMPEVGLDPGYESGLSIAASNGWHFGSDIVFPYGPLGFLDLPLALSRAQFVLALGFSFVVSFALWALAAAVLGRALPAVWALIGASVFTVAMVDGSRPGERALAAVGMFAIAWFATERFATRRADRDYTVVTSILAAAAAVVTLVKFSEGAAIFAVTLIFAAFAEPARSALRNTAVTFAVFCGVFAAAWLLCGQRLADIAPWVRGSIDLTLGFGDAMSIEKPPFVFDYVVAAAVLAAVVVRFVTGSRGRATRDRTAVALIAACMLYFGFKQGFTRHDDIHVTTFFALAAAVVLSMIAFGRVLFCVAVTSVALLFANTGWSQFDLLKTKTRWAESLQAIVDGNYHGELSDDAASDARSEYDLSGGVLDSIGGRKVSVDPWEATLPWAYKMSWAPAPIFQSYTAYTPELDRINARWIADDARGDHVVLRDTEAMIDDHNPQWESPEYTLALMCNYTGDARDGHWQVLRRSGNRCGSPSPIGSSAVTAGRSIEVPRGPDGSLVIARFTPAPRNVVKSAVNSVLKRWSAPLTAQIDGESVRLPRAFAGSPLLVGTGMRDGIDSLDAETYRELSFSTDGTVTFEAIPIT